MHFSLRPFAWLRASLRWATPALAVGCLFPPGSVAESTAPVGTVDFLRDVRPILASQCFKCHGPDELTRKGGLRLDVAEDALKPAKSGERALVPGKPEASELIRRILATSEDDVMPPPSTKRVLTDAQKETLRRWIVQGAEYRPHWAFVLPQRPPVPEPPSAPTAPDTKIQSPT